MNNHHLLEIVYKYSTLLYIFCGAIAVIATAISIFSGHKIQKLKDQEFKEVQITAELKISEANKEAKKAVEDSAKANLGAQQAIQATEEAYLQQQILKKENLLLGSQLEEEKISRLELEKAIAPRIMEQNLSSMALKKFKGIKVSIVCIADIEAWNLAGQIAFTLKQAGWDIVSMTRSLEGEGFFDGVTVESNVGYIPKGDHAREAAEALIEQLTKNEIASRSHPAINLQLNSIVIKIGFRPSDFFSEKVGEKIDSNIKVWGNKYYQ